MLSWREAEIDEQIRALEDMEMNLSAEQREAKALVWQELDEATNHVDSRTFDSRAFEVGTRVIHEK